MIGPTTIKVCNADITREDKKLTKMDLYVSINIGKQHYETKVCKNSGPHPEWNETFKVTLAKEKEITVEIWNGALGDDVLIAEGKIAVQDISRTGKGKITWINLFFDRKPAGKMMLEMHSEESEKKQDSKKGQTTTAANGEIDELKQQLKDLQFEVNLIKSGDKNSSQSLNSKVGMIDNLEYNEPTFKPKNFTLQSQSLANYYMDSKITAVLQKALEEVARVRPQFPLSFIGQYLIANDLDRIEWEKSGGVDPKVKNDREPINYGVSKGGDMKYSSISATQGLGMGLQGASGGQQQSQQQQQQQAVAGLGGLGKSAMGMVGTTGTSGTTNKSSPTKKK